MALRPVRLLGDPILRASAERVAQVDDALRALIEDMYETMYAEEGVGLAAPQVGVGLRVIVVDPREPDVAPFALVNPEVVESGEELEKGEEGCLSIPGIKDLVERPTSVVVSALDDQGEPVRMEAEGLLARILQHEIDHINGILFVDRLSPLKRTMLLRKWQKVKPDAP